MINNERKPNTTPQQKKKPNKEKNVKSKGFSIPEILVLVTKCLYFYLPVNKKKGEEYLSAL